MNTHGTVKATRFEPETGRLQYLVERDGASDWHYANDPKFISEFGDMVKKFIAQPMYREEKRRRPVVSYSDLQMSPKSSVSSSLMKATKREAASTSSETSSVQILLPVGRFKQTRLQHTSSRKVAEVKTREEDFDDEDTRYSLTNGLVTTTSQLKRPEKRPASPAEPVAKRRKTPPLAKTTVHEMMRKKILLARSQQLQRDKHRQLLSSLVQSAASRFKPVSMKLSPAKHRNLEQSVVPSPSRRNRTPSPRKSNNEYSNSAIHLHFQQQQAAINSFLSQPDFDHGIRCSSVDISEASTSDSTSSNSYFSNVRRVPKRQAAAGSMNQSLYSQLVLRHRPGWTQIWLFTRTRMQNSFNPQVCEELAAALKACIEDADTSLILISSSGPTFSSGIDLNYLLEAKVPSDAAHRLSQSITDLCNVMLTCSKPIFVAVNGLCVGIGVALCCLADVVIATEKAVFSTPYTQLGHVPEGGLSTSLQNAVGRVLASDMLLAGRRLTAVEALRSGLVSRILWPTNFVQELLVRLDVIASNCSPALEATKFLMRSAISGGSSTVVSTDVDKLPQSAAIARAIEIEADLLELFWTAPESRVAMRRYVDSV